MDVNEARLATKRTKEKLEQAIIPTEAVQERNSQEQFDADVSSTRELIDAAIVEAIKSGVESTTYRHTSRINSFASNTQDVDLIKSRHIDLASALLLSLRDDGFKVVLGQPTEEIDYRDNPQLIPEYYFINIDISWYEDLLPINNRRPVIAHPPLTKTVFR
jgi:hypothetical protein